MTSTIRRPAEPITPADFRRAAVIRLGIVVAFFVANVAARFGVAESSPGDPVSSWRAPDILQDSIDG